MDGGCYKRDGCLTPGHAKHRLPSASEPVAEIFKANPPLREPGRYLTHTRRIQELGGIIEPDSHRSFV